jgi:hypothetical protein
MDKLLTFQTSNDKGIFLYTVGEGRDKGYLEKTASGNFHPEIAKYISDAQKIEGKTQVLLTALGAGEYWGSNVNGDFFPETSLKNPTPQYGYKTFEKFAKVYKHHVNKDPNKSYGDVALSVWNEKMKRVELICILDDAKAPDLVEKVNNGEYPEVSMGCKVPYDVCSICSNKAKTRAQYCDHLRYHMNKIPPGHAKKAYAINTLPRFFDISFVLIGADRIAAVMKKVASAHPQYGVSSAHLAESQIKQAHVGMKDSLKGFEKVAANFVGLTKEKVAAKKLAEKKLAEITKEVPSNIKPETVKNIEDLAKKGPEALHPLEPKLSKKIIINISSGPSGTGTLNKVLSTLSILGIVPKREEFQDIALRSLGKPDLAEEYSRKGILFDPSAKLSPAQSCACHKHLDLSPRHFDDSIFQLLRPTLEDRSYIKPLLHKRVIRLVKLAEEGKLSYPNTEHVKIAEDERQPIGALPMMLTLAGLWAALGDKTPKMAEKGLEKIIKANPGVALAVGVGAVAGFNALTQRNVMGKYDFNPDKGPMFDPNQSWQDRIHEKNKNPLTKTSGVGKRLMFGVPALYMASGMQTVKKARNPHEEESAVGKFIRKNPDVASALLVGEAMAGKPISGKIQKGLSMLRKTASLGEDLKSTAIFSMAFPGASLPVRAAGSMVDMGIISGIEKLLKKRNSQKQKGGINA